MRTLLALLVLLAPRAPIAAQAPTPAELAALDSLFAEWDREGSPGASVAVVRDGEVVFAKGYGTAQLEYGIPIVPATIFHVASVTKQFTAFAVALLEAEGALGLDDDIRVHLPELPDLGAEVTVRHLVHHTSGIRDQWALLAAAGWRLDDVITREHILTLMQRQSRLNFPPGQEYLYSNTGYTLLAEIVERVSGRPFPAFMEERVFAPLGMTSTHMHTDHEHLVPGRAYSYAPDPDAEAGWRKSVLSYANAGATSLFTTAPDLARWLANFESGQVGGPGVVERMRERGVLNGGDTIPYAFAIIRDEHAGRTTWGHGGADAGFRTSVVHVPEERLGVVVLSNAASFPIQPTILAVLDVFLDGGAAPDPVVAGGASAPTDEGEGPEPASPDDPAGAPTLHPVPAELLDRYAGRYAFDGVGVVEVARTRDGLEARRSGTALRLVPVSDSVFVVQGPGARLTFHRDGDRVTGATLSQGPGRTEARRIPATGLTARDAAAYEGVYYSPELETVYRMAFDGERLVARHLRHGDIALEPAGTDRFLGSPWFFPEVTFQRDVGGLVTGFHLTGARVRELAFVRLDPEALPGG